MQKHSPNFKAKYNHVVLASLGTLLDRHSDYDDGRI